MAINDGKKRGVNALVQALGSPVRFIPIAQYLKDLRRRALQGGEATMKKLKVSSIMADH